MRPAIAPFAASLLFLLCAGVARAQGALLVVDAAGGPGSDFTTIVDALAAASDGDTLLVRSGDYLPFIIQDRTIIIAAAPGASVNVQSSLGSGAPAGIIVRSIGASQAVVLEGLTLNGIEGFGTQGSAGLSVEASQGQVWVQDCQIVGGSGSLFPNPAIAVASCDQVLFAHCTATGTSELTDVLQPVAPGVHSISSRVFAWDCHFTGGLGGAGVLVDGREFFAEDSVLTGGQGLGFPFSPCDVSVDGGPGLALVQKAKATLVGTQTVGGAGDPAAPGCSNPGPSVANFFGTLVQLPGPTMDFSVTSPVADGQDAQIDFAAQPGDVPVLLMGLHLGPATVFPKFSGALVFGNSVLFVLSPLPASGAATVSFGFGDALPPGTGSTIFLQGAVLKATGGALLGDAAVLNTFDG